MMETEIERKFLVSGEYRSLVQKSIRIMQGYLSVTPECTVRVRLKGDRGFITVKGESTADGTSRLEWEKEITPEEATDLMKLCRDGVIDKTRHIIEVGEHIFEVDEFHGENEGLVIAEIELSDASEAFERPHWLGKEVTGDIRYYNSYISSHPYGKWGK